MGAITIFAGHYGSGKTTAAVNYALKLRREIDGEIAPCAVVLCDMDIVNPYFRTADYAKLLAEHGVELISSSYANTNVEMPWLPTQAVRVFDDPTLTSIIDLGGDDCGALALGRYAQQMQGRGDIRLLMVVNPCRPMTRDIAGLRQVQEEIEAAAGLKFTGIVNSTNLGEDTTAELIAEQMPLLRELAQTLGLPIVFTAVPAELPLEVPEDMGERLDIVRYPNRFGA